MTARMVHPPTDIHRIRPHPLLRLVQPLHLKLFLADRARVVHARRVLRDREVRCGSRGGWLVLVVVGGCVVVVGCLVGVVWEILRVVVVGGEVFRGEVDVDCFAGADPVLGLSC